VSVATGEGRDIARPDLTSLHDELAARLFELTVALDDLMQRGLAERNLTRARATVVAELRRRGPVVQRELSQALGATPRNVTGLVDALEASGLVTREPHPTDRRATLVRLTEPGAQVAARLHADQERFGALLFEGSRQTDLEAFAATLDVVLDRLHTLRAATDRAA
jgi:DNA-binding MarR family transcriptional regulator